MARTSPKAPSLGDLPARGPKEGRKVLFTISQAQPDSTGPATVLFCPSGIWAKGNSVGSWLWAERLRCAWVTDLCSLTGSLTLSIQKAEVKGGAA